MTRRFKIKWIDQNVIEVEDCEGHDSFYMNGDIGVLNRFEELRQTDQVLADLFFEGFLMGVDWADGQLKHCEHNFIMRD
jgi:hypothetical protein